VTRGGYSGRINGRRGQEQVAEEGIAAL